MNTPENAFLDILLAAMQDAVIEQKLTQIKATIAPDGKNVKVVRIVVMPEAMEHNWPKHQPLGSDPKQS